MTITRTEINPMIHIPADGIAMKESASFAAPVLPSPGAFKAANIQKREYTKEPNPRNIAVISLIIHVACINMRSIITANEIAPSPFA
jgi:hypothetical protein